MKRIVLCVAVLGILTSGCASNPAIGTADATVQEIDYRKIDLVESAAAKANVRVIWVNQPTRRVPAGSGS